MPLPFRSRKKRFVRTNGQDIIRLTMTFEYRGVPRLLSLLRRVGFGKGKSELMSCALARPYKQLFEKGKPIGRINHIFFKVNRWPSHVLGSLCFTSGQQLLFYPGLTERKVNWCFSKKKGLRIIKSTGVIDHITLDKKFQRWHVTILEPDGAKKLRLPSFRSKKAHKNTLFWFGLTVQDHSFLETTPEELTLTFPSPPRDSKRRLDLLIKARKDAILHLTTLNKMSLNKGEFLHFDFFIGPSDLALESLPCFVPTQEPIVYGYAQAFSEGTHFRGHPVSLEGVTKKIWVVVSKHVGRVSDKAIMVCL